MSSALKRYAYAQARVRARRARLLGRAELEALAADPNADSLERELGMLGGSDPTATVLAELETVVGMLEDEPRELLIRYRDRYALDNLHVVLRAVERREPYAAAEPLLVPVGQLGPGRTAEELASAASLAEAVARLEPRPFGEVLRRQVRAAGPGGVERFRLEAAAEREVYEAIWAAARALPESDRRAATPLLGVKLDGANLLRVLRLRLDHGLAPEEVLAYAIRGGRYLGASERAVLAHEPPQDWASRLAATPYGAALAAVDTPWLLERALAQILREEAERALVGAPFHVGVPLAYLVLLELQAADLRRILAGRRLARPGPWVRAGLIGAAP